MTITAEPQIEVEIAVPAPTVEGLLAVFEADREFEDLGPCRNAALAYAVLDLIKANPGHLDMSEWARSRRLGVVTLDSVTECGTTACFAGWTVLANGDSISTMWKRLENTPENYFRAPTIRTRATELLGLDAEDASYLFLETSNADLESRVREIFGPDPRRVPGGVAA